MEKPKYHQILPEVFLQRTRDVFKGVLSRFVSLDIDWDIKATETPADVSKTGAEAMLSDHLRSPNG